MNQYNAIINSDESFFEKKIIESEENIIHMFIKQNFHKLLRNVEYYHPQIFMDNGQNIFYLQGFNCYVIKCMSICCNSKIQYFETS